MTSPATPQSPAPEVESALRTLLLTDLVDSTKLVRKLGDAAAFEISTRHDRMARDLLGRFDGREIDKSDGFLLLFDHPADAVAFALAYHRALAELSVELEVQLRARAGIHVGEVYLRHNAPADVARGAKPLEVEGLAKPTAARTMSLAGGKQTLLTREAFELTRQSAREELKRRGLRWLAHGPYLFKGLADPMEIFEVGEEGIAPLTVPPDSEKARRAVAAGDELTLGWRAAPGQEIPRRPGWFLESRLGEGGFGEIWLARQRKTGEERVFKFCYHAEKLRALQREVTLFRLIRDALGQRDDIVRILDWDLDHAPYYLETEHAAGGDLVDWAAERGGLAAVPRSVLLELLAQVAEALAAAHSVGVLHKDVKPRNVLVTMDVEGRPRMQLTDFGAGQVLRERDLLARGITVLGLTEEMDASVTSSTGGTHRYMAPELLEGKAASVQADIYALGVMLYQVAVCDFSRALAPGWRREVDDELLADDIAALVDGSAERRPSSATEVAARLRSLEERRERLAAERRAAEETEAARRALARSHKRRKISAAVATAAVVVLAVVSVLAVQASKARREADSRREQAEGLIQFMVGDLREKLTPLGRLDILDDVGERALDYFAEVPEASLSDQELLSRSRILSQIGDVRISQGNLEGAMKPLGESLALARSLLARSPEDTERIFHLSQSHYWTGFVHFRRGELDLALENFRAYLALAERLVAADPGTADWQLELSYAHSNLGSVLRDQGDLQASLGHFEETLSIVEQLAREQPADSALQYELATTYSSVGFILESLSQIDEALEHYRAQLRIGRALLEADPEHSRWIHHLALSHLYVGGALDARGEVPQALQHFLTADQVLSQLVAADSTNSRWQRNLARSRGNVAMAERLSGRVSTALRHANEAVEMTSALAALDATDLRWQQDLGRELIQLGHVLEASGDNSAAAAEAERAIEILSALLEEEPADRRTTRLRAEAFLLSGRAHRALGHSETPRIHWQQALDDLEPLARDSRDKLILDPWVEGLLHLGRTEEARPIAARLIRSGYRQQDFLELCTRYKLLSVDVQVAGNKAQPETPD